MSPKELWTKAPRLFVGDQEKGSELRDYLASGGLVVSVWIRYTAAEAEPTLRFRDERGQVQGEQAIRSLVFVEEIPAMELAPAPVAAITEQQAA